MIDINANVTLNDILLDEIFDSSVGIKDAEKSEIKAEYEIKMLQLNKEKKNERQEKQKEETFFVC